jgi:ELWxxDGT repeat protein
MKLPNARGLLAVLVGGAITVALVAGVPSVDSAVAGDDLEVTPLGVVNDVYSSPCVVGDQMLFVANGNDELWVTGGTTETTSLVTALDGYTSLGCAVLDGRLYFAVSQVDIFSDMTELWVTDGTAGGTFMVSDFGPASRIGEWVVAGDVFFAVSEPVRGTELWMTDGTEVGTRLVAVLSGQGNEIRLESMTAFGDRVAFVLGGELWISDGTSAGTGLVAELASSHELSDPDTVTAFGDRVLVNTVTGLWMSDGTATGTRLLTAEARLAGGRAVGDRFLFNSWTSATGFELWVTDGTVSGTELVADTRASEFERVGAQLVFGATSADPGKWELWVSDGTVAGTGVIARFESHVPQELFVAGDRVVFGVFQCCLDAGEVWVSDLTASGTRRLLNIYPAVSPRVFGAQYPDARFGFTRLENLAVFGGFDEATRTSGLWVTDGTLEGTGLVAEIAGLAELRAVGDKVIFIAGARSGEQVKEQFHVVVRDSNAVVAVGDYSDAPNLTSLINADNYSDQLDAPVLRLYQAYFNRDPDLLGAKYWLDVRRSGHRPLAIAGFMAGSQEFANNYQGVTDEVYLTRVYRNVLGRDYDQAGFNYWLDAVRGTNQFGGNPKGSDLTRAEVLFYISGGEEFIRNYPYTKTLPPENYGPVRARS